MTELNPETQKPQTDLHIENAQLHVQKAYVPPESLPHDPAPLRAALVPLAAVPAGTFGFFLESVWGAGDPL